MVKVVMVAVEEVVMLLLAVYSGGGNLAEMIVAMIITMKLRHRKHKLTLLL